MFTLDSELSPLSPSTDVTNTTPLKRPSSMSGTGVIKDLLFPYFFIYKSDSRICLPQKGHKKDKKKQRNAAIKSFTNQTKYEVLALEILQENVAKEPFA